MRTVAVTFVVLLVGCAATQEGPVVPDKDARTGESIVPDAATRPDATPTPPDAAPRHPDAAAPTPDAPATPTADAPDCVPTSTVESCNGKDDDCDGHVDDGFDVGKPCSAGVGACEVPGMTICNADGTGVVCSATPGTPMPFDACGNDIDDDCDGEVDNGFPDLGTLCSAGVGECARPGIWQCNEAGDGLTCSAVPGAPKPEECGTNHDENCDGNVDEGFPDLGQECSVGVGHCKANGLKICDPADLTKTRCSVVAGDPEPESCNGVDDNCDGHVDEGDPGGGASCTTGKTGECGPGHLHCVEGILACVPDHIATAEVCDGLDNDCDGIVDNGFNIGQPCNSTAPIDFCANGHYECANLFTATCVGDTTSPEVCNGRDDNCDGHVDENWDFFNDPDNCGGCNRVCSGLHTDQRQCSSGACNPTCSFGWQSCDGDLANGCETLRNTYDGAMPEPTGYSASVSGDEGRAPVVLHGFGEARMKVRVTENDDGPDNLHAQFRLQNPDGVAMQLCISGAHCGGSGSACAPIGGDESAWASADETPWPLSCNDDSFDAFVEVRFIGADRSACGNWTLTIYSESDPPDGAINIDVD